MSNNKVLVVTDFSNWLYYTIYGCTSAWMKTSSNAINIKKADETDQDNLPDILAYSDYRRMLNNYVHKRLDTVNWIAKQNHQDAIDSCDDIDVIFTMDDSISNNFRKQKYPGYKAQRKLVKKQYDVDKVKTYITDVIIPSLNLEKEYGYIFVKVPGCESDDIIASIMRNFNDYACRILISSDHDFLQLDNVYQYDMAGNPISRTVCETDLDSKSFLLWKIIRGDISDNIAGVFKGVGEKKALKLINDKPKLKNMLKENQDSAKQFILNKYLIDFDSIPKELEQKICNTVTEKLAGKPEKPQDLIGSMDDLLTF